MEHKQRLTACKYVCASQSLTLSSQTPLLTRIVGRAHHALPHTPPFRFATHLQRCVKLKVAKQEICGNGRHKQPEIHTYNLDYIYNVRTTGQRSAHSLCFNRCANENFRVKLKAPVLQVTNTIKIWLPSEVTFLNLILK